MTTAIRVGSKENTTTYYIRDGEEETIATETGEININSSDDNPLGIEVEVTFPKDNEPVKYTDIMPGSGLDALMKIVNPKISILRLYGKKIRIIKLK